MNVEVEQLYPLPENDIEDLWYTIKREFLSVATNWQVPSPYFNNG